jgi:Mrp family chromosome partitioning ATPase
VLPVTDAVILSQYADATLILAAAGQTRRADLRRAAEKLDQVSAKILGIVLNKVTRQTGRYYGYGYGYGYSYKPYHAAGTSAVKAGNANGSGKAQDHSPR